MSEKISESLLLNSSSPGLNRLLAHNDLVFAAGLAVVLATLIIPLPTFLLDILLACSIAVAIATLVTVLAAQESIEFSAFPSLLRPGQRSARAIKSAARYPNSITIYVSLIQEPLLVH